MALPGGLCRERTKGHGSLEGRGRRPCLQEGSPATLELEPAPCPFKGAVKTNIENRVERTLLTLLSFKSYTRVVIVIIIIFYFPNIFLSKSPSPPKDRVAFNFSLTGGGGQGGRASAGKQ